MTKRENVLESLNYISFVNWAAKESPNLRIFVSPLACEKVEKLKIRCALLSVNRVDNLTYVPQN